MLVNLLLATVMLSNFVLLGTSRIQVCIRVVRAQGLMLASLPLLVHPDGAPDGRVWLLVLGTAVVKGYVIPTLLLRALSKVKLRLEVEPYIGFTTSMMFCAGGTAAAVLFANRLPMEVAGELALVVPASLATVFAGLLVLVSRRKAITQVVGYVALENGIYLFSLLLLGAMPLPVETAVLLDLFAGIFVMGIVMNHIQREFSTLDTSRLSQLKE